MKEKNLLWEFFTSVKLAIFTFLTLAATSIIGTVIPQNEPFGFYVENFGPRWATLFKYLDVPDMYHAWWFVSLLVLFSLNLIACSLDRIPNVVRILRKDNLAVDVGRLEKRGRSRRFVSALPLDRAADVVRGLLAGSGWTFARRERDGGVLFFAEKGGWTRFGVYTVHGSILVIFIGAIIGSIWGYKASVMIAEGTSTDQVYARDERHTPIPLGFRLRCDRFLLTHYANGMPKDYISDLSVIKDGKVVLQKRIEVNDPLQYAGLTFYQSSYQPIENQYVIYLQNTTTGAGQNFIVMPLRQMRWEEEQVSFGIVERSNPNMLGQYQHKIWFSDGKGSPVSFWVRENQPVRLERPGATYTVEVKQRFATGLQVAKDPGVWPVYIGCTLMLLGLAVVFFMSHRRVWVWVRPREKGRGCRIVVSGNANKNREGLEKDLDKIESLLQNNNELQVEGA